MMALRNKFIIIIDLLLLISPTLFYMQIVLSLTVLPDGRLASTSGDSTIRVWDLGSGACDRVLTGHTDVREGDACI